MKNRFFILLVACLCCSSVFAQTSRLIGLTKTKYNGTDFSTIGDTAFYMYGAALDTTNSGALACDSSYTLVYGTGYTTGNQSYRYYQTFTGANLASVTAQYFDTPSSGWVNYQYATSTYDGSNNLTSNVVQVWDATASAWVNKNNTMNTYAGTNNTLKIVQNWNTASSAWMNRTKDSFAYDGSNNMIYHLAQNYDTGAAAWINNNQINNTYNTANQVINSTRQNWSVGAATWKNNTNTVYRYNASALLCNTIGQRWDTGSVSWLNNSADSLDYDASADKIADTRYRWDTSHVWLPQSTDRFTYDGHHDILTDTTLNWNNGAGAFVYNRLKINSYNTYNQVLVATSASWDNTAKTWYYRFTGGGPNGVDIQYRYYYDLYPHIIPVKSGNLASAASGITVYPNPTGDLLTISLNWSEPTSATIVIYDAAGGVVRSWSETATKNFTRTISINDLPAGNYFIKANGGQQQLTQQFVKAN